jgi:hypothetical protein
VRGSHILGRLALVAIPAAGIALGPVAASASGPFIGNLTHVTTLGSTVPHNGDINPYGMAVVTENWGRLVAGNVLVSNFNASSNEQGTGTTIVQMTPHGGRSVFAHITSSDVRGICTGGVGLTTALAILQHRWVVVGSLPTSNGMSPTAKAGCLIILDSNGNLVETLNHADGINGPWDLAAVDRGADSDLFVTNVLNGTVAAGGDRGRSRHRCPDRAAHSGKRRPVGGVEHGDRLGTRGADRSCCPGGRTYRRRGEPLGHTLRRRHR